jgi:hypothetical protein
LERGAMDFSTGEGGRVNRREEAQEDNDGKVDSTEKETKGNRNKNKNIKPRLTKQTNKHQK